MAPPIAQASMEVPFVQSQGRTSHVVVEQQPDRSEKVRFTRAIFTNNGVDALVEEDVGTGEISIIHEL
jgi:hypothetical protein